MYLMGMDNSEDYMDKYHWTTLKGVLDREYDRLLAIKQMKKRSGESVGYPFTEFEVRLLEAWEYYR